jgi:hypothetical protein
VTALPGLIDALEAEQAALAGRMAGAEIYAGDPVLPAAGQDRLLRIDEELDRALERWEALDSAGQAVCPRPSTPPGRRCNCPGRAVCTRDPCIQGVVLGIAPT